MARRPRKIPETPNSRLFLGFEHAGLHPNKRSADEIAAWYKNAFGFTVTEEAASLFLSGSGTGRLEIMKDTDEKTRMHIAIRVSNFEEAVAALQARGIPLKEPLIGPDLKIVYLQETDPEGNPVHLWWAS